MNPIVFESGELSIHCCAKINLGLHILKKRSDGFHDIETTFKIITLHDHIRVVKNKTDSPRVISAAAFMPKDETNICIRALNLLRQKTGCNIGVDLHIVKHIPIGAGLGGGSSDAAGILVGFNEFAKMGLKEKELMSLGMELGSDVPFFIGYLLGYGNTAIGRGRGESLDFYSWNLNEKVLLVYPNVIVSTAWAYANFNKYINMGMDKISSLNLTNTKKNIMFSANFEKPMFFDNFFEPLVFAEHPEVRTVYDLLEMEQPLLTSMSGSGSTIYAVFQEDRELESVLKNLSGYYAAVVKFVDF
jgi:4-diphosphocytidyl-2-C-methyl-D-erythritol kinase